MSKDMNRNQNKHPRKGMPINPEQEKLKRRKRSKRLSIASAILTVLAQLVIGVFVFLSYKYYSIDFKVVLLALAVVLCILIIGDILFFVGFKYRDRKIRIINIVIASLIVIAGSVGSFYVWKVNSVVNKIIENSGTDQYETVGGVFTYYTKSKSNKTFEDLDDLKNAGSSLKIGVLYDDGVGTGSLAKEILDKNSISAEVTTYNTTDDLLSALVGGEDDYVDVAVFPTSYRQRLSSDEEVDYSQYLDNLVDFYSFEEKVKTGENENANKDLSVEPFNILLIGFAPEDEAMTYGLADTIIVATVNPQTFTVSMTSIARDSFVPISCYGGAREKVNAARGTSRQCLMDTVGDLLDLDIDYYMEVNFLAVVEIVDAVGGVTINNPVEFVGQTASGIRGEYTVLVPAGEYNADGEQALAFARERHAMPGGDFDRQLHQQQVISEVVRRLLAMKDVNQALDVMEAAGKNMSTNLSLTQLTGVFNYLITARNNTGLETFDMIDIQNMRITGYSSWTYNYGMNLPLWIYKLYNGSIQESKDRINDVMNNYTASDIKQTSYLKFFAEYPYERGQLYSDYFAEAQDHEELPSYYPYLTKYTYQEAMEWASANGVTLSVTFIKQGDAGYDASLEGRVVDQNPRQGALIKDYPNGSITVMGAQDPNYVPEYTVENCNDETSCKAFADSKGITVAYENKTTTDTSLEGKFAGTNYKNGEKIKKNATFIIYKYSTATKTQVSYNAASGYATAAEYKTYLSGLGFKNITLTETKDNTKKGTYTVTIGGVDAKSANGKAYTDAAVVIVSYVEETASTTETAESCAANGNRGFDSTTSKCSGCASGYHDESGTCVADTTPTATAESCAANGNRGFDSATSQCSGCISGYHDESGTCVVDTAPTETADTCTAKNRTFDGTSACGDCVTGYHSDGGSCVAD